MAQNLSFNEEPLDEQKLVNIVDSIETDSIKEDSELVFENNEPSAKNILPVINIPEAKDDDKPSDDGIIENNNQQLQEIKINTETLQNELNKEEETSDMQKNEEEKKK